MTVDITTYTNILVELNKAVKMHNFYPSGHPQLGTALEKCYLLFRKTLEETDEIRWRVDRKAFYDNKTPLAPTNRDLATLANKIFFRRVTELAFNKRLTQADLKALLSFIKLEPEEVAEQGGAEVIFAENDVNGILLNKLDLNDLKRLKKQLEEKKEEERKALEARDQQEAASGEANESHEEVAQDEEKTAEEERQDSIKSLVERIRNEMDSLRYKDLAVRIKEQAALLLIEEKYDEIMPALFTFEKHARASSGLEEELKETALESLDACINTEMLHYLLDRVGAIEEPEREAIQHVLVCAGDEAAELLLDAVIEADEAVSRRHFYNTILLFGERIRGFVEKRLEGGTWFLIRQMVSIIGDLGQEKSLDALEATYQNEDVRVKKEVLKSLVKIRTPRSKAMLMAALEEKDESLVNQAIISLGMLKDNSAIDVLSKFALKREAFTDTQESKKEAIKALGTIGDPKAIPILSTVLFKTVWFGKKANKEVRVLAANSLGMIGTPEAYEALEKVCDEATGDLQKACKRILEGRTEST